MKTKKPISIRKKRSIYNLYVLFIPLVILLNVWDDIDTEASVLYVFQCFAWDMSLLIVPVISNVIAISKIEEYDSPNHYSNTMDLLLENSSILLRQCIISFITSFVGIILWITTLRLIFPWENGNESIYDLLLEEGCYASLLEKKQWVLYYVFFALRYSFLSVVLEILTYVIKTFLFKNLKGISYFLPLMAYYIWGILLGRYEKFELNQIYNTTYRLWEKDWKNTAYAIIITLSIFVIGVIITSIIEGRRRNKQ